MGYGTGRGNRAFRPEEVNEIRARYAQGGETYLTLARFYEVSEQTIARIITGRTYATSSRAGGAAQAPVGLIPMPGVLTDEYIADATKRAVALYESLGHKVTVIPAVEEPIEGDTFKPGDDPYAKD